MQDIDAAAAGDGQGIGDVDRDGPTSTVSPVAAPPVMMLTLLAPVMLSSVTRSLPSPVVIDKPAVTLTATVALLMVILS